MKNTILAISILVIIYSAFAFGYYDLNPRHWDSGGRSICAFFMIISLVPLINAKLTEEK